MELHNIQKLRIDYVKDNLVRVVITKDDVRHVADKEALKECFASIDRMIKSEDYPEKLAAYKASKEPKQC